MGARLKKQLTIVAIAVAVVFVSIGVYRVTHQPPEPTCFDHIKNQNEVDVDCGGVCGPCTTKPQPAVLEKSEFVISEQLRADVVLTIKNPNNNFGLQELPLTVEVLGEQKDVVGTATTSTYLLPQEQKEVVVHAIETRGRPVKEVRVIFGEATWVTIMRGPLRDELVITDQVFQRLAEGPEYAKASGVVVNNSNYTYRVVDITVIVRDGSGNLIAARGSEMRDLRPGEKRGFPVTWRVQLESSTAAPRMDAMTNLFLQENFIEANDLPPAFRSPGQ